jgi:PleD family two-component response regulator
MDSDNEREALPMADEALYRAKRRGRNQVQSFVALSPAQVQ